MSKAFDYLLQHKQSPSDVDANDIEVFLDEMNKGLYGESSLPMIPSYLTTDTIIRPNEPNIVIDAGGTNFRSAIATFVNNKCVLTDMSKTIMAGIGKEVSKARFYDHIAYNIKHLVGKGNNIGFCFSYNVKMNSDIDGVVTCFSKEVRAPQVIGTLVGRNTLDALKKYSTKQRKIAILNDTVATLLGGAGTINRDNYSTFIGYIYGTGTNISYVENNANIGKIDSNTGTMVINTECGSFDKFNRGDFDFMTDKESACPGQQVTEKMCSGRYLSSVIYNAVATGQKEGLYNGEVVIPYRCFADTAVISDFLYNPDNTSNKLYKCFFSQVDRDIVRQIALLLIERASKIGAIMNVACMIKSAKLDANKPIGLVAEGTTFNKLYGYKEMFTRYLDEYTAKYGIKYELISEKNLNLIGTAIATMNL